MGRDTNEWCRAGWWKGTHENALKLRESSAHNRLPRPETRDQRKQCDTTTELSLACPQVHTYSTYINTHVPQDELSPLYSREPSRGNSPSKGVPSRGVEILTGSF